MISDPRLMSPLPGPGLTISNTPNSLPPGFREVLKAEQLSIIIGDSLSRLRKPTEYSTNLSKIGKREYHAGLRDTGGDGGGGGGGGWWWCGANCGE